MSARADLTGQQFGEWSVVEKAPAVNRIPFWAVAHTTCGVVVNLPHTLMVSVSKGKGGVPPCIACTPSEAVPAVSHGMHLACGTTHLVGQQCGKAGPGECKHGRPWRECAECLVRSLRSGITVENIPGGTIIRPRRELDLDALAVDSADFYTLEEAYGGIADAFDPVLAAAFAPDPLELDLSPWEPNEPEILRNGRGQPMIVPPGGGKAVAYTRASTFAKTLDDAGGLTTWKVRLAALGMARRPDLAMMAAALEYGDRELDQIIETAHDAAGGNEKANWGTAVHSYTDPRDDTYVPEVMQPDVTAYLDALASRGITVVSTDKFVVNDKYRVAGTYDNVLRLADGRHAMSDKKTGTLHPLACAIQLAIYAGGDLYEVDGRGYPVRTPLEVDQDVAIIAHIPKGAGTCELYEVDLTAARAYADLALSVRAARRLKVTPLAAPVAVEAAFELELVRP